MEVAEIRPGVWRWTAPHPAWEPGKLWPRDVGCVYAETRDAVVLIDPLVPEDQADQFWRSLDRDRARLVHLPVRILLTCAWHRRSADEIAERYEGDVWRPGETLPDGVEVAVFDDTETRWREAVFAFPNQSVVVFGDVVEGDGEGGLRMPPEWWPPHDGRTGRIRNELRRVLDWPIDVVLVAHGEPRPRRSAPSVGTRNRGLATRGFRRETTRLGQCSEMTPDPRAANSAANALRNP